FGIQNPMLKDVWQDFILFKEPESLPATILNYRKNWYHGLEFWHEKYVLDLNERNITAYRNWYLKEKPTRSFHHTFFHFQSWLRFLKDRRILREIPKLNDLQKVIEIVERNAKREKVGRVYTDPELKALLMACDQLSVKKSRLSSVNKMRSILESRARLGLLLGANAGLRKSEMLSLKKDQVSLSKKEFKVWSTKNSNWRVIPLTDDLIEAF